MVASFHVKQRRCPEVFHVKRTPEPVLVTDP